MYKFDVRPYNQNKVSDLKQMVKDLREWCDRNEVDNETEFILQFDDRQHHTTLDEVIHQLRETLYNL